MLDVGICRARQVFMKPVPTLTEGLGVRVDLLMSAIVFSSLCQGQPYGQLSSPITDMLCSAVAKASRWSKRCPLWYFQQARPLSRLFPSIHDQTLLQGFDETTSTNLPKRNNGFWEKEPSGPMQVAFIGP